MRGRSTGDARLASLAAFPVSGLHAPAITLTHPLMRDPMMPGTGRHPVAFYPFMPAANPVPISPDPNKSWRGRYAENFYARRRRRDHHYPVGIVTLIGNDHASGQGNRKRQAGCKTRAQ
jgi:hypothetical protein